MPDDNTGGSNAGLISAGVQAGTAIGRGIGANKRQKRARKWALEDWDRVNAYNHPQAQMQRLQEAKLNPHLVYGQSSGGASGSAQSVQQTSLDTSIGEEIGAGIGAIPQNLYTQKLQAAQTADTQQAATKKAAETINIGVKTEADKKRLQILKQTGFREKMAQINQTEESTEKTVLEGLQLKRTDKAKESQEISKAEIASIEAKLRRNGLTPNSPDYLKLMVLNKSELQKLLNYFK